MNSKLYRDLVAVCYRHTIWKVLPSLGIALSWTQGRAADICVLAGDYVGFQVALNTSAQNGEDDLVMLQSGTYDFPSISVIYNPTDPHDLTIAGGYEEFEGDPCGGIISHDARQTVLNGAKFLDLKLPDGAGSITLSTLSVTGVLTTDPAYAIQIYGPPSSTGSVHITNSIFAGNVSFSAPAIYILVANSVLIENSLFYENATLSGTPTIQIGVDRPSAGLCMGIVHSTFTQNTSAAKNVKIWSNTCGTMLGNDIFWGNGGGDLQLASSPTYVWNADVGDLNDFANAITSQAMSQDPLFNPDFSLSDFSPLRDAGVEGGFLFANGDYDAFGNPRIDGAHPDIGAFEISDVIFAHAFDW